MSDYQRRQAMHEALQLQFAPSDKGMQDDEEGQDSDGEPYDEDQEDKEEYVSPEAISGEGICRHPSKMVTNLAIKQELQALPMPSVDPLLLEMAKATFLSDVQLAACVRALSRAYEGKGYLNLASTGSGKTAMAMSTGIVLMTKALRQGGHPFVLWLIPNDRALHGQNKELARLKSGLSGRNGKECKDLLSFVSKVRQIRASAFWDNTSKQEKQLNLDIDEMVTLRDMEEYDEESDCLTEEDQVRYLDLLATVPKKYHTLKRDDHGEVPQQTPSKADSMRLTSPSIVYITYDQLKGHWSDVKTFIRVNGVANFCYAVVDEAHKAKNFASSGNGKSPRKSKGSKIADTMHKLIEYRKRRVPFIIMSATSQTEMKHMEVYLELFPEICGDGAAMRNGAEVVEQCSSMSHDDALLLFVKSLASSGAACIMSLDRSEARQLSYGDRPEDKPTKAIRTLYDPVLSVLSELRKACPSAVPDPLVIEIVLKLVEMCTWKMTCDRIKKCLESGHKGLVSVYRIEDQWMHTVQKKAGQDGYFSALEASLIRFKILKALHEAERLDAVTPAKVQRLTSALDTIDWNQAFCLIHRLFWMWPGAVEFTGRSKQGGHRLCRYKQNDGSFLYRYESQRAINRRLRERLSQGEMVKGLSETPLSWWNSVDEARCFPLVNSVNGSSKKRKMGTMKLPEIIEWHKNNGNQDFSVQDALISYLKSPNTFLNRNDSDLLQFPVPMDFVQASDAYNSYGGPRLAVISEAASEAINLKGCEGTDMRTGFHVFPTFNYDVLKLVQQAGRGCRTGNTAVDFYTLNFAVHFPIMIRLMEIINSRLRALNAATKGKAVTIMQQKKQCGSSRGVYGQSMEAVGRCGADATYILLIAGALMQAWDSEASSMSLSLMRTFLWKISGFCGSMSVPMYYSLKGKRMEVDPKQAFSDQAFTKTFFAEGRQKQAFLQDGVCYVPCNGNGVALFDVRSILDQSLCRSKPVFYMKTKDINAAIKKAEVDFTDVRGFSALFTEWVKSMTSYDFSSWEDPMVQRFLEEGRDGAFKYLKKNLTEAIMDGEGCEKSYFSCLKVILGPKEVAAVAKQVLSEKVSKQVKRRIESYDLLGTTVEESNTLLVSNLSSWLDWHYDKSMRLENAANVDYAKHSSALFFLVASKASDCKVFPSRMFAPEIQMVDCVQLDTLSNLLRLKRGQSPMSSLGGGELNESAVVIPKTVSGRTRLVQLVLNKSMIWPHSTTVRILGMLQEASMVLYNHKKGREVNLHHSTRLRHYEVHGEPNVLTFGRKKQLRLQRYRRSNHAVALRSPAFVFKSSFDENKVFLVRKGLKKPTVGVWRALPRGFELWTPESKFYPKLTTLNEKIAPPPGWKMIERDDPDFENQWQKQYDTAKASYSSIIVMEGSFMEVLPAITSVFKAANQRPELKSVHVMTPGGVKRVFGLVLADCQLKSIVRKLQVSISHLECQLPPKRPTMKRKFTPNGLDLVYHKRIRAVKEQKRIHESEDEDESYIMSSSEEEESESEYSDL